MTKWDYHMFFSFSSARRDFVGRLQVKWNFHQDDFWRSNSLSVQEYTALDTKSEVCMHWEGIEYLDRYLSHMCWKTTLEGWGGITKTAWDGKRENQRWYLCTLICVLPPGYTHYFSGVFKFILWNFPYYLKQRQFYFFFPVVYLLFLFLVLLH